MKTEDITSAEIDIITADNWNLKATLFVSQLVDKEPKSVLILLPAMGSHSRPARFMAAALAQMGHAVLTADLRGHGKSLPLPKRGIDYGFDTFTRLDIPAIVETAKGLYPGTPVFVIGHSLGGILAGIYAAENPSSLAGVITLAAGNLSLKHLSWGAASIFVPFYVMAKLLGYVPGQYFGWGNPLAKTQVIDWASWGFRRKLLGSDGRELEPVLAKCSTPILCLGFSDDLRLAPPKVVSAFADLFPPATTRRLTISPEEAGVKALGHFEHLRSGAYAWAQMDLWILEQLKR